MNRVPESDTLVEGEKDELKNEGILGTCWQDPPVLMRVEDKPNGRSSQWIDDICLRGLSLPSAFLCKLFH